MMDAVNYIRERARMCKTVKRCNDCPVNGLGCGSVLKVSHEMILELVEQWSAEHPLVTNGSELMKILPTEAIIDDERIDTVIINIPRKWWDAEQKGVE